MLQVVIYSYKYENSLFVSTTTDFGGLIVKVKSAERSLSSSKSVAITASVYNSYIKEKHGHNIDEHARSR